MWNVLITKNSALELEGYQNTVNSCVENAILLMAGLYEAKTKRQAFITLLLFLKTNYNKSLFAAAIECIRSLELFELSDNFDTTAADQLLNDEESTVCGVSETVLEFESGDEGFDWIRLLSLAKDNWQLAIKSKGFDKISKLISMCGALGLCDLNNFTFDVNGIRVFSIEAQKRHVKMTDFVSAVLDTVYYFAQGGYTIFRDGNIDYFLYSDTDAQKFTEQVAKIKELANYAKNGNLDKHGGGITENDFAELLDDTIDKSMLMIKRCESKMDKIPLVRQYEQLCATRTDFRQYRVSGKLRESPYSFTIVGTSGVGKSSLSALFTRFVLMQNGYDASDERMLTINEGDKYMSNAKSSVNAIFYDDVGNTKPDYVETAPTQRIIELCNNVPHYAVMAELDQKGKVSLEPKVVCMTSNICPVRLAQTYSREPMSIVRRNNVIINVSVKKEFTKEGKLLDSRKVLDKFGSDPTPDVWDFTLQYADNENQSVELKSVFPGKVGIATVLQHLYRDSRAHFANQRFVVENNTNLAARLKFCETCNLTDTLCTCPKLEEQSKLDISKTYSDFKKKYGWSCFAFSLLPRFLFENSYAKAAVFAINYETIVNKEVLMWLLGLYLLLSTAALFYATPLGALFSIFILYAYGLYCYVQYTRAVDKIVNLRGIYYEVFSSICRNRERLVMNCGKFALLVAVLKTIHTCYKIGRKLPQGNITNPTEADIAERDREANPWVGPNMGSFVPKGIGKFSCTEELLNNVRKNTYFMRVLNLDDGVPICNAFAPKSNYLIIPSHMFHQDNILVELWRERDTTKSGNVFNQLQGKGYIERKMSYHIPNTDLVICYFPGMQDSRDLIDYLPKDETMQRFSFNMHYVNSDGVSQLYHGCANYSASIPVKDMKYEGYNYELNVPTFAGLCMAPLVIKHSNSFIAGFHLAGNGVRGAAGIVRQQHIADATEFFKSFTSVALTHNSGKAPLPLLGKEILMPWEVHHKSCVNHLNEESTAIVYGACGGQVTPTSKVKESKISPIVEEVCGVPNSWGPPKMGKWKPFWKNLENTAFTTDGCSPETLEWAANDYLSELEKLMKTPYWKKEVRPLDRVATVSGIDGKRFIDQMPPSTSAGMPLCKPKADFQVLLDPNDYPDNAFPRTFIQEIWEAATEREQIYLGGERAYGTFKASLKDEPTKVTKDKVRVFFGADLLMQLIVRKYFLTILRLMCINPIASECAVGVNSQGPEWQELVKHMTKFGLARIFAGDYKSYDTKMPAQFTLAAWNILIRVAELSGNYTQDDLTIMRGAMTDCCYPCVAFNGTLMSFRGVHASGINVTANVGSIINSLLKRCAYYENYHAEGGVGSPPPYRSLVADMCYGDDFKGSIHPDCTWLDNIKFRDWLAKHDIVLTMPDKKSAFVPFLSDDQADFLKRKNRYDPDLEHIVGVLAKDSIFKSLHSGIVSASISEDERCAQVIDGALREMAYYGEEDYESFRIQMQEVARRAEITKLCLMLDQPYINHIKKWRSKYLGENEDDDLSYSFSDLELEFQGGYEQSKWKSPKNQKKLENKRKAKKNTTPFVGEGFVAVKRNVGIVLEGLRPCPNFWVMAKKGIKANFQEVIHAIGKPIVVETQFIDWERYGDIDLAFAMPGGTDIIVVEVKSADNFNTRSKSKKQVKRACKALKMFNPKKNFHAFIMCGCVLTFVASYGEPSKKTLKKLQKVSL